MIEAPSASTGTIRAPRGTRLSCKGWHQEGALRMLMNSVDPEVAEPFADPVVNCGAKKAVRNRKALDRIVEHLQKLDNNETLLVESGLPAGVFRTHRLAPRVLIAGGNLAGHWSNRERFRQLDRAGLSIRGGITAGCWMDVGTQAALPGAYETFAVAARKHFGGTLAGKLMASGGMGSMGGAQPLAVTMNGGAFLGIDVDPERIKRRERTGYCDIMVNSLDEAVRILRSAIHETRAISVGLVGNCAEVLPEMAKRGIVPDLLTDQTSADDPLFGYIPRGYSVERAAEFRERDPQGYVSAALDSIVTHVRAMLDLEKMGAVIFDSGNNIGAIAFQHGLSSVSNFPGFIPAYTRPLLCEGKDLLRWVALSGEPADIATTDDLALELFPENEVLARWIRLARKRVKSQGLPARACWLGHGERARFGLAVNDLVAQGKLKAPVVIGRDHFDCGSGASQFGETEAMRDGTGAVTDWPILWPILNALLDTAAGATWVWVDSCGAAGIGYSLHSGQATVADGTADGAGRLERVLTCDAGPRITRDADRGHDERDTSRWERV